MGVCNNMSCDGFRGVVGFENLLCSSNNGGDADVIRQRLCGSGFPKQESRVDGDDLRAFKLPKTASQGCNNGNNPSQQMLCFSSPNSQMLSFSSENSHSQPLPFYHRASAAVARTPGFGMHGVRCLFTPSQWMELEHQALIYKYITANVPIPSYLHNPIRKDLESSGCFSILRSNALGWGGFHLGFNSDPEPGRCRRTDGKKWRCSRDAVPDQKYCERHINRGRHRSRKPVEASVSGNPKVVVSDGGASKNLSLLHLSKGENTATDSVVDKETSTGAFQQTTPLVSMAPGEQQSAYVESEFGLVCSDSLLNPLNKSSSFVYDGVSKSQHVVLQFMDAYPKSHSPRLPVPWSNVDLQSDRTQLSISIPCASPTTEKLRKSPFRLCEESEATRMGLCVGWEPSVGGPLGEALHSSSESKALNQIQNWDHSSRLGSSYRSVSNNSPRAESSSTLDAAGFCNAQGLMLPSLPAL